MNIEMNHHEPVLVKEVLEILEDKKIKIFVDATLGLGGHAENILKEHSEIEKYIGMDQDEKAIDIAKENLKNWKSKLKLFHENFKNLEKVLKGECIDAILFDIGVSSMQLDDKKRGFSFRFNSPLDMRMDKNNPLTAEYVVNKFSKKQLEEIFKNYAEEPKWRKAASYIIEKRKEKPIKTTEELGDILKKVCVRKKKIHPATRCFQGLRIFVNDELNILKEGLKKAISSLRSKGKIIVISFHSLEDRIVKNIFRDDERLKLIFKKPLTASLEEKIKNPRSRSAKLRAAEKI